MTVAIYEDCNIKNLIVFGDWHGNGRYANAQMGKIESEGKIPDVYLHTGDFGVWKWAASFLKDLETTLARQNRELWFVDGNHEDFVKLSEYPYDERGLQKISDHIFRIPRGYAWIWGGKKFVGLGGAFSVDMRRRTAGFDWFPDELIIEDDFQKAISHGSADVLVSHEAPWLRSEWGATKTNALDFTLTPEEEYYGRSQREYIAKTIETLNPKVHVHGHHHTSYTDDYFGTKVIGLNCDGRSYDENAVELDLSTF